MNTLRHGILILVFLFLTFGVSAQKTPTRTVENIETNKAVQIAEAAAKELGYTLKQFDSQNKIIITDWFEWTAIAITNHAKLKFEAKNNQIVITMIERQYKSEEGWSNSLTGLSKKNQKKYLGTMADKIAEIAADKKLTEDAMYNSELIRMFKPVVTSHDFEWKFVENKKDMLSGDDRYQDTKTPNYVFELSVTNKSAKTSTVRLGDIHCYILEAKGMKRKIDYYGAASFNKFNTSLGYKTEELEIAVGETKKVFLYFALNSKIEIKDDIVPYFLFNFMVDKTKYKFENYNIPVPFQN